MISDHVQRIRRRLVHRGRRRVDTPCAEGSTSTREFAAPANRGPGRGIGILVRQVLGRLSVLLGFVAVSALVCAPVAAQRAVEGVAFEDRLGSLPVRVSLAHNGVSTLDTGVAGQIYWDRTGAWGFGAYVRATGPPEAGGTLSSYVSPKFVQANAQFVAEPDDVAGAYSREIRGQLLGAMMVNLAWGGVLGGVMLTAVFRWRIPLSGASLRRRSLVSTAAVLAGLCASSFLAVGLFREWEQATALERSYPMPGEDRLSFSSPQALEIARQVQPFIQKNTTRIRERAAAFESRAVDSLETTVPAHQVSLALREGEVVQLAEADPQGAQVGTRVRARLYQLLTELLGENSIAIRTISGDITSNGTLAEEAFVHGEADASPGVPVVAVKGDHDTLTTVDQLADSGVTMPHLDPVEVNGVRTVSADDPAFKALFGGLVINESGISETEMGRDLRDSVDPEHTGQTDPSVVLVHQPRTAAGYLDLATLADLEHGRRWLTEPRDDGIPDVPPGVINVGHLHDAAGPWVVWNTDTEEVTWTVVAQLGTSGGVEENPTINRFSTPFSAPLKVVSVQLQYVDVTTGLMTGYASIDIAPDGGVNVTDRVDVGLS